MNSGKASAQMEGMICDINDRCCMGRFTAMPAPGGAFELQPNE
jgi:hypothetical protein